MSRGRNSLPFQTGFIADLETPRIATSGALMSGVKFVPRLMVPLCLSYDHRVIDGAEGARFCAHLAQVLGDLRRALL